MILNNLDRYFERPSFKKHLFFGEQGNLSFHWSNHRLTTKKVKEIFKHINFPKQDLWIEKESFFIKSSTSELLTFMVQNASRKERLDFVFDLQNVSLEGLLGNFQQIHLAELIKTMDYQAKFYELLLANKIPQRSFRLNTHNQVLMTFGHNFKQIIKMNFHQFNRSGILLESEAPYLAEIIEDHDKFKFYIGSSDTQIVSDFYSESERDSFVLSPDKIKVHESFHKRPLYLYIKFRDLSNKKLVQNLQWYLDMAEEEIVKKAS